MYLALFKTAFTALIVPTLWIIGRTFFILIVRDFARRFALTLTGIRLFDRFLGRLLRDPVWSGYWRISWRVKSSSFSAENVFDGRIYRCFDTIAAEGRGFASNGAEIPYGFIGKLSRDNTILTGTWFDRRGAKSGYHGTYQIRLPAAGTVAKGKWLGFSDKSSQIKVGEITWERTAD